MKIGYFTERPYRWAPEEEVFKNHAFFAVSNKYFDREKGADDYNSSHGLPASLVLSSCSRTGVLSTWRGGDLNDNDSTAAKKKSLRPP